MVSLLRKLFALQFRISRNYMMDTSIDLLTMYMDPNPEFAVAGEIHATLESNTQYFSTL